MELKISTSLSKIIWILLNVTVVYKEGHSISRSIQHIKQFRKNIVNTSLNLCVV